MSLRARVTLAAGAAVLITVVAVSTAVYLLVRQDLRGRVDESLQARTQQITAIHESPFADIGAVERQILASMSDAYIQGLDDRGQIVQSFPGALPLTDEAREVARGERLDAFYDTEVDGEPIRTYSVHVPADFGGGAIQFGESLTDVEDALSQLVVWLALISMLATGLATALGAMVAATAVSPVNRLSQAARTVARTGDLSYRIPASGTDELTELAQSFNTMLDALEGSLGQQRQLVADASHELRTPLASVRTNVEVLQRAEDMDPDERKQVMRDIVAQIAELSRLVEDLVELARGDSAEAEPPQTIVLGDLVADVVERARPNHPSVDLVLRTASPADGEADGGAPAQEPEVGERSPTGPDSEPNTVTAAPQRLARAIRNLIDNAAKWSPPGGQVTIEVSRGAVSVTDEGPGIDPQDLPHIFDRFYRSSKARSMPGSGLGLAIVKQVADSHGGTVTVETPEGGGSRFTLRLG